MADEKVNGAPADAGEVVDRLRLFDISAIDAQGQAFDVEVQRSDEGAVPQRARYHSAMLDMRTLEAGEDFKKMRDSYVIFITENDYFKKIRSTQLKEPSKSLTTSRSTTDRT